MQVHTQPGSLPPFWDRSAIFFANLLSLFYGNEGETETLRAHVGGIETYGGLLVPIIDLLFRGSDNLLILERTPDATLMNYFRDAVGLSLPEMRILSHDEYCALADAPERRAHHPLFQMLSNTSAGWIDGFVTDDRLTAWGRALGKKTITSLDGSKRGNNKLLLHQFLQEADLPRFDTIIAADPGETQTAFDRLRAMGYAHAVVKSQIGASGIGMTRVALDGARAAESVPEYIFFEGPCLVQGWLDPSIERVRRIGSPSVQLFINDDAAYLYDITEQILSAESIHEGNIAPPPYLDGHPGVRDALLENAARAAGWLYRQGYRGTASTDFLVIDRKGRVEVIVCEINARVTGATYPAVLARHCMPGGSWLMRNMKFSRPLTSRTLLDMLDQCRALYRRGAGSGVLPINFNLNDDNEVIKGQFLYLAPEAVDCMERLLDIEIALPVEISYDRD